MFLEDETKPCVSELWSLCLLGHRSFVQKHYVLALPHTVPQRGHSHHAFVECQLSVY